MRATQERTNIGILSYSRTATRVSGGVPLHNDDDDDDDGDDDDNTADDVAPVALASVTLVGCSSSFCSSFKLLASLLVSTSNHKLTSRSRRQRLTCSHMSTAVAQVSNVKTSSCGLLGIAAVTAPAKLRSSNFKVGNDNCCILLRVVPTVAAVLTHS